MFCYDLSGDLIWEYTINEPSFSHTRFESGWGLTISDFDGDGIIELMVCEYLYEPRVSTVNKVVFLDLKSQVFRSFEFEYKFLHTRPLIDDFDNDGVKDILFSSSYNFVHYFDILGNERWTNDYWEYWGSTRDLSEIYAVDLDGDSSQEIFFFGKDRKNRGVYFVDTNGRNVKIHRRNVDFWYIYAILDLDNDGRKDLICRTERDIRCLGINSAKLYENKFWYNYNLFSSFYGYTDEDGDLLNDFLESFYLTDKNNPDTDSDGFTDSWEIQAGLDPLVNDRDYDLDNDGLTNWDEYNEFHTSTFLNDTDGDGKLDINDDVNIRSRNRTQLLLLPLYLYNLILITYTLRKILRKQKKHNSN